MSCVSICQKLCRKPLRRQNKGNVPHFRARAVPDKNWAPKITVPNPTMLLAILAILASAHYCLFRRLSPHFFSFFRTYTLLHSSSSKSGKISIMRKKKIKKKKHRLSSKPEGGNDVESTHKGGNQHYLNTYKHIWCN